MNINAIPDSYVKDDYLSHAMALIEKPDRDYLASAQFETDVNQQAERNAADLEGFMNVYYGTLQEYISDDYMSDIERIPDNRYLNYILDDCIDFDTRNPDPKEFLVAADADPNTVLSRTRALMGYHVIKLATELSQERYNKAMLNRSHRSGLRPQY